MEPKQNIVALVQARMNSSRLPGKVLKKIGTIPSLELLLHRLQKSKLIDEIVVVTSINPADDSLYEMVKNLGFHCSRGSENNVLQRYIDAIQKTLAKPLLGSLVIVH